MVTLAGLTTFLLINLNKVFSPAIAKLYNKKKFSELNDLYKKTTFLVNLIAVPLSVIIAIFSDEILALYTADMLNYKFFLFFMLFGAIISLFAGSSGTFMIMTGLEQQNLNILVIKSITIIILSILLVPVYGMISVVILYVFFMLFVNCSQLFYIKRAVNISPFSLNLLKLFFISIFLMYFAITQHYVFDLIHFILIPIGVYLVYFLLMFRPIKNLIKELQ